VAGRLFLACLCLVDSRTISVGAMVTVFDRRRGVADALEEDFGGHPAHF
jgi:hypothetical protein